ncbi:oligopeptide ABC transporter permease [Camelliibacillus cellulosilyticus]|uniref:Oligopeptide ABC transporter permease n=1 Tax=Camelliibacillus cellulosilyticus TaxID=2174486 RepID=A0ABV9GQ32_9BACL
MAISKSEITKDMFEPAVVDAGMQEEIARPSISYLQDAFRRLRKNKAAIFGAIVIAIIVIMALIGPLMNKYGVNGQDLTRSSMPPRVSFLANIHWLPFDGQNNGVDAYKSHGVKENFWFGTDKLGRDLWTRLWMGTRISLFIGVVAAVVDLVIGIAYGGISGYFGGRVDNIMQRIYEVLMGIPQLVLIILLIIILQPGLTAIILALAMTGWIGMSRIVRGQILRLKESEYVMAARTLGASHGRIISKHLVPNTVGIIIIHTMFSVPGAIFFEAYLSFIGLGLKPPIASLGTLINDGYQQFQIYPYQALFPGIIISVLLLAFNAFGDGLRDALDPKMRQ